MQRDMDLFREILLSVEDAPVDSQWSATPLLGHSIQEVVAHVRLIEDAGLVEARYLSTLSNELAVVIRLTNSGYDFLEESRPLTRWEQAKAKMKDNALPMTVSVVKAVLDSLVAAGLKSI
jgi:hypothetical protein